MFQSDNLLPFLTATENVLVQCSLNDDEDALDRACALLAELGLAAHADAFPDQLSGGQRQRVAVARALVHGPSLIVADEPTGSLDADNANAVLDLLLEAQRASGATLVLVTHEPAVASRFDRRIGMRDGRVIDGPEPSGSDSPSRRSPSHHVYRYAWRDLLHNPRRTLAALAGVTLGIGLFSGVLFFMDASGATMTQRALAPLTLDIQRIVTSPAGGGLRLTERLSPDGPLGAGERVTITLVVDNDGDAPANEVVVSDVPPPPLTYVGGTRRSMVARFPTSTATARSPRARRPRHEHRAPGPRAPR